MSRALTSPQKDLDRWLGYQLVDRPNPPDHPDYTTLLGGQQPLMSIRECLESLINQSEWSFDIQKALDDLGVYFHLPKDWWKNREGIEFWHFKPIAATFADSWIYRQWLHLKSPDAAKQFDQFFAQSVMHPEWPKAVDSMTFYHYPEVSGNGFEVLFNSGKPFFPGQSDDSLWRASYRSKLGKELRSREMKAFDWLQKLFTSHESEKAKILEEGLNHISFATIRQDRRFFVMLGRALSMPYTPPKKLSLEQIQKQPISKSKKEITNRQWCRRIWVSRGLWLFPSHILQRNPFSLHPTTISELTGKHYPGGKRQPKNDELYLCKDRWFNEWQDEKSSISLTSKGKKMLPEFSSSGFYWSIVSADFD